jgi:NAD(P)H dehydrogenase (quinone)
LPRHEAKVLRENEFMMQWLPLLLVLVFIPVAYGLPDEAVGHVDRVIRPGVAYEFLEEDSGDGVPQGLLKARIAIVFNTSNTLLEREHRTQEAQSRIKK